MNRFRLNYFIPPSGCHLPGAQPQDETASRRQSDAQRPVCKWAGRVGHFDVTLTLAVRLASGWRRTLRFPFRPSGRTFQQKKKIQQFHWISFNSIYLDLIRFIFIIFFSDLIQLNLIYFYLIRFIFFWFIFIFFWFIFIFFWFNSIYFYLIRFNVIWMTLIESESVGQDLDQVGVNCIKSNWNQGGPEHGTSIWYQ